MQAKRTMEINFWDTRRVTKAMLPLLERSPRIGRVVTVSSTSGVLNNRTSSSVRARFLDAESRAEDICDLARGFVSAAAQGKHTQMGYDRSAYAMSKASITQLMRVMDKEQVDTTATQKHGRGVRFVSTCPGLCRTDMAGGEWKSFTSVIFWAVTWLFGHSANAGADTPVFLSLLSASEFEPFAGRFVRSRLIQSMVSSRGRA